MSCRPIHMVKMQSALEERQASCSGSNLLNGWLFPVLSSKAAVTYRPWVSDWQMILELLFRKCLSRQKVLLCLFLQLDFAISSFFYLQLVSVTRGCQKIFFSKRTVFIHCHTKSKGVYTVSTIKWVIFLADDCLKYHGFFFQPVMGRTGFSFNWRKLLRKEPAFLGYLIVTMFGETCLERYKQWAVDNKAVCVSAFVALRWLCYILNK